MAIAMVCALQFPNWQWLSLTLAAPVVVWGGWPFHRDAFTPATALGLATSTALMVGTGRGAQLGILIKDPRSSRRVKRGS